MIQHLNTMPTLIGIWETWLPVILKIIQETNCNINFRYEMLFKPKQTGTYLDLNISEVFCPLIYFMNTYLFPSSTLLVAFLSIDLQINPHLLILNFFKLNFEDNIF